MANKLQEQTKHESAGDGGIPGKISSFFLSQESRRTEKSFLHLQTVFFFLAA